MKRQTFRVKYRQRVDTASYVDAKKLVHECNVCCNTVSDSDNGAVAHKIADDMTL